MTKDRGTFSETGSGQKGKPKNVREGGNHTRIESSSTMTTLFEYERCFFCLFKTAEEMGRGEERQTQSLGSSDVSYRSTWIKGEEPQKKDDERAAKRNEKKREQGKKREADSLIL